MIDNNMPVMLAAVAKDKTSPVEKSLPRDSSNSSFYKQFKQISQRQKCQSGEKLISREKKPSNISLKPGSKEVVAASTQTANMDNEVITNSKPNIRGFAATNPKESVYRLECNIDAPETVSGTGMGEETEVVLPANEIIAQLVPAARQVVLPEEEEGQATLNHEIVSADMISGEKPVKGTVPVPEILTAEEVEGLEPQQIMLPAASGTIPTEERGESLLQVKEAKDEQPVRVDQASLQDASSDIGTVFSVTEKKQIRMAPIHSARDQKTVAVDGKSDLVVLQDNIPAAPSISSIENNTEPTRKEETLTDYIMAGDEVKQEVKPGQTASVAEKVVKEAPEIKQWVKELLPVQSAKPKALPESGAEEKQNTEKAVASSKTVSATDVKKLIDFESHRLNASRLRPEPQTAADGKAQTISDDVKTVISGLSRSDTDLFKAANGVENSKNLSNAREIMAQVVQKAELLFNHKLSELKIDLKPEFLGRLTIKVMVEEGVVTARFIAENQQVKHLLETNLHTLRQNLESQGLRVDRAEVNVGLNNGGMFDGSEGSRQYLWQEGQSPGRHQGEGYPGDNQYEAMYPEEMNSAVIPEAELGFNENGKLSYLV